MEDLKLAILIDADNISPKYVKVILDEAATFGVAACKRIYGDWSDVRLKSWKDALLNNSIIPIQQYSYTTGKNATDSAMIIDAMDLLYGGNLDGFCIVSSDSDFTRLAARLREAGKLVIGMGESSARPLRQGVRPVQIPGSDPRPRRDRRHRARSPRRRGRRPRQRRGRHGHQPRFHWPHHPRSY